MFSNVFAKGTPGWARVSRLAPYRVECRSCLATSAKVMTFTRIQFTLVSLLLASAPLAAQEFPLASEVRRTAAAPAAVAPTIDGDVLGDPAWMGVPAASGFVQTAPDEGQPASEKTEVRVVFTDDIQAEKLGRVLPAARREEALDALRLADASLAAASSVTWPASWPRPCSAASRGCRCRQRCWQWWQLWPSWSC